MSSATPMFSVHDYDRDGDLMETGVYLHFDLVRVKVCDTVAEYREFVKRLDGMAAEIEENYS